jgi:hypothetical protein
LYLDEQRLFNERFRLFHPVAAGMASARQIRPGSGRIAMTDDKSRRVEVRASLVDAVMDLSEVQDSSRMEATVPLGDAESLEWLRDPAHAPG